MIQVSTFFLASASMAYQLSLAHACSLLLGSSVKYYIISMAFYIFFMGMGSFCFKNLNKHNFFYVVEFLLIFLGASSLPLLYLCDIYFSSLTLYLALFFMASIGFLSGLELPFLMNFKKGSDNFNSSIYMLDFIGAGCGVFFFFLLIFSVGFFYLGLSIALINLLFVILLWYNFR